MNLELDSNEIINRINKRNLNFNCEQLFNNLIKTFDIVEIIIDTIKTQKYNYTKNIDYINPLIWELGHTLFFWEHICLKPLNYNSLITKREYYDSFRIARNDRFNLCKMLTIDEIENGYNKILDYFVPCMFNGNKSFLYLIRLGQLHQEMHNESFIFSNQLLGINPFNKKVKDDKDPILKIIEMIDIPCNEFIQGVSFDSSEFYFDNEAPSFKQKVDNFKISKYCITNYQYLQFVKVGGYTKKEYWLEEGYSFITQKNQTCPIYWKKKDNKWYQKYFDKYIPLQNNHPVIYISWYEAMAFCKFNNCRLPYEKEWEYLAQMCENEQKMDAHLNYGDYNTISVLDDRSANSMDVVGLFGNCWEWCLEPLYPYDGFKIDPVYREMSYPFFGYKRVCRGGSWAVPEFLINSHYRNAQAQECTCQMIGFRIVI
uniref:Sulfatase-modifying factor enzyme-like domain-containing protein n=1 Tax=viral metagenome TaxID=1070528 RepID=A0A6C0J6R5_9ZZZZ